MHFSSLIAEQKGVSGVHAGPPLPPWDFFSADCRHEWSYFPPPANCCQQTNFTPSSTVSSLPKPCAFFADPPVEPPFVSLLSICPHCRGGLNRDFFNRRPVLGGFFPIRSSGQFSQSIEVHLRTHPPSPTNWFFRFIEANPPKPKYIEFFSRPHQLRRLVIGRSPLRGHF